MKVRITATDVHGEQRELELNPETATLPLLDELEGQGVALAYGCRAGSCGVCRVRVASGADALGPRGFVEEDTWLRCGDGEDVRLACQATLRTPAEPSALHLVIEPAPEINPIED